MLSAWACAWCVDWPQSMRHASWPPVPITPSIGCGPGSEGYLAPLASARRLSSEACSRRNPRYRSRTSCISISPAIHCSIHKRKRGSSSVGNPARRRRSKAFCAARRRCSLFITFANIRFGKRKRCRHLRRTVSENPPRPNTF